jgi:hypothetical protein
MEGGTDLEEARGMRSEVRPVMLIKVLCTGYGRELDQVPYKCVFPHLDITHLIGSPMCIAVCAFQFPNQNNILPCVLRHDSHHQGLVHLGRNYWDTYLLDTPKQIIKKRTRTPFWSVGWTSAIWYKHFVAENGMQLLAVGESM